MSIKAVIFDLDGTITAPYFDFDAIREEIGVEKNAGPILEIMEKMSPAERLRAEKILLRHEQNAIEEATLNPNAKETLHALHNMGISVGILTRNRRDNATAIADKFGLEFDAVVGREDGPVKPDAFGVLNLCRTFGVNPGETLVVGDYLFDLLCARAAGAVAVLLTNHPKFTEFTQYADFTIETIDMVINIIKQSKKRL